jgi:Cu(I)/Ag(I) efflux system protein CusF
MGEASTAAPAPTPSKGKIHKGTGKVLSVDPRSGYVELDHDPIPSLEWPRMRMVFQTEDKSQLAKIKAGDRVQFEMKPMPNKDGDFVLHSIQRSAGK